MAQMALLLLLFVLALCSLAAAPATPAASAAEAFESPFAMKRVLAQQWPPADGAARTGGRAARAARSRLGKPTGD